MTLQLKILGSDLDQMIVDLRRPHAFAAERVGFLYAKPWFNSGHLGFIAYDYVPVCDDYYLADSSVGAMISGSAFRTVMQRLLEEGASVFHVHLHEHVGPPSFSRLDLVENARFVPSFFNARADFPHGALVLSLDSAAGLCWTKPDSTPKTIVRFAVPGHPFIIWRDRSHGLY